jgi:hypothetical protein
MPKIKVVRQDFIRLPEWIETLDKATSLDFKHAYQIPPFQHWLSAMTALGWMFGKRIHEVLRLAREDLWVENRKLHVKFRVGKKRSKFDSLEWMPYVKKATTKHKGWPYLKAYLDEFDRANTTKKGYLFPANTLAQTLNVTTKFKNKKGEVEARSYTYTRSGGYVRSSTASFWLKKANKNIWFHLARHSKGASIAEDGGTEIEIAAVLDCTTRTAARYTKHSPKLAERWESKTS